MKRRSQTSGIPTNKLLKSQTKTESRSTHKSKTIKSTIEKPNKKNKKNNKQQKPADYVLIDGNFYTAYTPTERQEVQHFVTRFKGQPIYEKYTHVSNKKEKEKMEQRKQEKKEEGRYGEVKVQEIVRNLPMEQKINLMKQLQKQFSNNPQYTTNPSQNYNKSTQSASPPPKQQDSTQKYNILSIKLQSIQSQLTQKRQYQIQKINKLFYEGELTASQRKNKIKDRKIKIINCTRSLFYTLLHNKFQPQYFKSENIYDAMRELDTLSEFQGGDRDRDRDDGGVVKMEGESSIKSQIEFEKINIDSKSAEKSKISEDKIDGSDKKSANQQSLLISPDKSAQKAQYQRQKQNRDKQNIQKDTSFQCSQQNISISRKLHIPLLLTKQKMQELQWQRKTKAAQKMRLQIQRKISFQMSQLQIQMQDGRIHFTTLSDINNFIVALYQYIIKKDLDHVVSRLNMPYGKATRDKLYLLQQNGEIDDLQYYSVLDQNHLNGFTMEFSLTVRRFSDQEKNHNKAVFDSFNAHLNAYRPYFDLDGDVYPWFVSEKGLTFYEINEDNIEQVFQKTKIKVLEQCSTLCGIVPFGIEAEQSPELLKQKNNENFQKQQKSSLVQNFSKWSLKLMDYDTMIRLIVAQQMLIRQVRDFARDLLKF